MYICSMKGEILCPSCIAMGKKPKVLGYYEDVIGKGYFELWCKQCHKSIRIPIEKYSLDR